MGSSRQRTTGNQPDQSITRKRGCEAVPSILTTPMNPLLVDIKGMAELLGVSVKTARKVAAKHPYLIPTIRLSKQTLRYSIESIRNFINK